jgi:LysM repeat protein
MSYKGKHRAPGKIKPRLIQLGTATAVATVAPVLVPGIAQAATPNEILEVIALCESGNRNVNNSTGASTASGYYQIINGTWRAYGGTRFAPRAIGASRGEQTIVARRILAGQGLAAWEVVGNSCWRKNIGNAGNLPNRAIVSNEDSNPSGVVTKVNPPKKTVAPKPAPTLKTTAKKAAQSYVIKRGDTLQKIAKRNGTTWRALHDLNRATVKNPNLIYTGNTLRLR